MVSVDGSTHPNSFIRRAGCHTILGFLMRCRLLLHTIEQANKFCPLQGVVHCSGKTVGQHSQITGQQTFMPRGGGHSGTEGSRNRVTYFAEEGVFFKTSTFPRFCKRRVLFCTQVRSMGVIIPLQSTKYTRL